MAGYFYYADAELSKLASRVVAAHQISIESARLEDELVHTQLEISELPQSNGSQQKKMDDIAEVERYKLALEARISYVQSYSQAHSALLRGDMIERIKYLHDSYPGLRRVWNGFIEKVRENRSTRDIQESYQGVIGYFDEIGFNQVVQDIVKIGAEQSYEAEGRIQLMGRRQSNIMSVSVILIFVLGTIISFLHRKAMQGQVHELQLAHASKLASLGELSAGVAHELNSPLMFIKGYNGRVRSVLTQAEFDQKSPIWQYLNHVDDGVNRITKIIRHFRDFSRMSDSTKMESRSINEIIENSFILLNERLQIGGIKVLKSLSQKHPRVLCSPDRLEQVLINLLNNAVDALGEVTASEKCIFVRSDVDGNEVVIKFQDNGVGISSELQGRIFDPFFTTKPMGKGTGLGLSVSQGIIRDHRGTISVESVPLEQTCFTIRLPLDCSVSSYSSQPKAA
jgi:signal transduction histidine kinase